MNNFGHGILLIYVIKHFAQFHFCCCCHHHHQCHHNHHHHWYSTTITNQCYNAYSRLGVVSNMLCQTQTNTTFSVYSNQYGYQPTSIHTINCNALKHVLKPKFMLIYSKHENTCKQTLFKPIVTLLLLYR